MDQGELAGGDWEGWGYTESSLVDWCLTASPSPAPELGGQRPVMEAENFG